MSIDCLYRADKQPSTIALSQELVEIRYPYRWKQVFKQHQTIIHLLSQGIAKFEVGRCNRGPKPSYMMVKVDAIFSRVVAPRDPVFCDFVQKYGQDTLDTLHQCWSSRRFKGEYGLFKDWLVKTQSSYEKGANPPLFMRWFASQCWTKLEKEAYTASNSSLSFNEWIREQYSDSFYLEPQWFCEETGFASMIYGLTEEQQGLRRAYSSLSFLLNRSDNTTLYWEEKRKPEEECSLVNYCHITYPRSLANYRVKSQEDFPREGKSIFAIELDGTLYCVDYYTEDSDCFFEGPPIIASGVASWCSTTSRHNLELNSSSYDQRQVNPDFVIQCFQAKGIEINSCQIIPEKESAHTFVDWRAELQKEESNNTEILQKLTPWQFEACARHLLANNQITPQELSDIYGDSVDPFLMMIFLRNGWLFEHNSIDILTRGPINTDIRFGSAKECIKLSLFSVQDFFIPCLDNALKCFNPFYFKKALFHAFESGLQEKDLQALCREHRLQPRFTKSEFEGFVIKTRPENVFLFKQIWEITLPGLNKNDAPLIKIQMDRQAETSFEDIYQLLLDLLTLKDNSLLIALIPLLPYQWLPDAILNTSQYFYAEERGEAITSILLQAHPRQYEPVATSILNNLAHDPEDFLSFLTKALSCGCYQKLNVRLSSITYKLIEKQLLSHPQLVRQLAKIAEPYLIPKTGETIAKLLSTIKEKPTIQDE